MFNTERVILGLADSASLLQDVLDDWEDVV